MSTYQPRFESVANVVPGPGSYQCFGFCDNVGINKFHPVRKYEVLE